MFRLTNYICGENSGSDFGSELIDGEIDFDINMEIEEFSDLLTIYTLGSRFQSDDDDSEEEPIEGVPVGERKKSK